MFFIETWQSLWVHFTKKAREGNTFLIPCECLKFNHEGFIRLFEAGVIGIDEIQRRPEIFPILRYLTDANPSQKYLILGSASRDLIMQRSETLAGRIAYYRLGGFRPLDVGIDNWKDLWIRGELPPSFLSKNDKKSGRGKRELDALNFFLYTFTFQPFIYLCEKRILSFSPVLFYKSFLLTVVKRRYFKYIHSFKYKRIAYIKD